MIDWLLSLINKRQRVLYNENQKLKEENQLLRSQLPAHFPKNFSPSRRNRRPPTPKPIDRSR
jgi:hypothetical protein